MVLIIWSMRFVCYLTKATHTKLECIIYLHIPTAKIDRRKPLDVTFIRGVIDK